MSRKDIQVFLIVACFVFSVSGVASGDSIVGSKHDFSASGTSGFSGIFEMSDGDPITETCVFCHTPHNASTGGYLWNRTNPSATDYTLYTSATLTKITLEKPTGLTLMCMSCHDGITSIAVGTLLNEPYSTTGASVVATNAYDSIGKTFWPKIENGYEWGANIGNKTKTGPAEWTNGIADLSNDHPVSFVWQDGIPGVNDYATWSGSPLKLFNGRMECSTCHNVHDKQYAPFLRMSNNNSDMCTTCHAK